MYWYRIVNDDMVSVSFMGQEMRKKLIYVDMDDTLCDFFGAAARDIIACPGIQWPQSQHNFFRDLQPLPNAIRVFNLLREDARYEMWILTRPSILNRLCYTEKADWVVKWLGEDQLNRTIFSPDKSKCIGDILIDDIPWPYFKGEQMLFGGMDYPDWLAIEKKLLGDE